MKTTFSRTFFLAAIILLAALLMVGASLQMLLQKMITKQSMDTLKSNCSTISQLAAAYYADGKLSDAAFFVNLSVATRVSDVDAVICNAKGQLVLCSDSPMGCSHQGMMVDEGYLQAVFQDGSVSDKGLIKGLYPEQRYVVGMPITDSDTGLPVGLVIVSTPESTAMAFLDSMADTYMLVSVLVIVAGVAVITFMARKHSSPLQEMAKAARDFGHGQLDSRVQVNEYAPKEIQSLAHAFNNMASSLQKSEYQRQEFVANVSHELKTPMTTISGYLDGMLDGTIPPERHEHYMRLVSDETKRLSRLVKSMLEVSRMQDQEGIPPEKLSRFDISECVGQVLISFEEKITQKNLSVEIAFPEHGVYTWASQDAITQVVYNLVDNAVKFCNQGGALWVSVRDGGDKLFVTVGNTGDTIPPEELPLLFDRFHKLDKSRARNREGWGLGLYIVKTLICRHGEDISVTSENDRTEFTFTLPATN